MPSLGEIQANARAMSAQHGWPVKGPEERVLHLLAELGELASEILKKLQLDAKDLTQEMSQDIGMEIYDVIWNLCDLANILEVDMEKAAALKMKINEGRSW